MAQIISFASARARVSEHSVSSRAAAVCDFIADLKVQELSASTIDRHNAELRRYGVWLDEQDLDWRGVTPADLTAYARTRAELSASSRYSLITSLRVFYRWCVDQEFVRASPAERLKSPKRTKAAPRSLSSEQIRVLVAYLNDEADRVDTPRGVRDQALLLTALYTGMRAAELAALRWSEADLVTGVITVMKGKGQKGRAIKVHPDLLPVLVTWRDVQPVHLADGPVFSLTAEPIIPNRVGKIAHRYAGATRLPLTAHVLRHTFATQALRRSGNVYAVSKALGHAQLQQTMIYVRVDPHDGEPAIDALPGTSEW